jgi:hypothetical protein
MSKGNLSYFCEGFYPLEANGLTVSLSSLDGRLMCPRCRSRRVVVILDRHSVDISLTEPIPQCSITRAVAGIE